MPRINGNQPLQLINQTVPSRSAFNSNPNSNSIWINIPATNAQLITANNPNIGCLGAVKPPASLRARPSSASGSGIKKAPNDMTVPQLNGWIKGNTNQNMQLNFDIEPLNTGNSDSSELHNKLYQLEKELKIRNTENKELTDKVSVG